MVGEWDSVLQHLLFHKSLIDEEGDGRKIDDYMAMVRNLETGMTVIGSDPIEKAISIAFQMVHEHGFNPWDIDLSEFTKMYMKRVRQEPEVNFVIAGRLILMAWSILKLQSEEVLSLAEPPAPPEPMEWDPGIYVMPEDIDYREAVLGGESPLLVEAVRAQQSRPVTLIELIGALDEAREEIRMQEQLRKLRDGQRPQSKSIEDKVHRENMQEDIEMTWKRIVEYGAPTVPLKAICAADQWDKVAVFSSVLFLAKHKRLKLAQRSLPYGEILITEIKLPEPARPTELSAAPEMPIETAQAAADLQAAATPSIGMGQVAVASAGQMNFEVSGIGRV
jgi:segregation and condensation protein A